MIYDKDADLGKLDGKTVAILGYGSQGHAHALNLKDSGVDGRGGAAAGLVVGRARPRPTACEVLSMADAASRGDVVMILLPDEKQAEVWERGDRRRDRARQPAAVRPRLLDPLRPDRARARAWTWAWWPRRAPATWCAASSPRATACPAWSPSHQDAERHRSGPRAGLRQGHRLHPRGRDRDHLQGRDRDRPLRRAGRALRRRDRAGARRLRDARSRPATTRGWRTSSACTSSS